MKLLAVRCYGGRNDEWIQKRIRQIHFGYETWPVGYNLQLKKVPEPEIAVSPSGHREGNAAEECGVGNRKLQKPTQTRVVMEKSDVCNPI